MLDDLTIKLPLIDAIEMIPSMRSLKKRLIFWQDHWGQWAIVCFKGVQCSASEQADQEVGWSRKFVLSIQIRKTVSACSLCDLGSSVNLMPYSVAKQLGFTDFKPTRISLVFADTSVKLPVGILEDLHVRVGNTFVPTDFFGSRGWQRTKRSPHPGSSFLVHGWWYHWCSTRKDWSLIDHGFYPLSAMAYNCFNN